MKKKFLLAAALAAAVAALTPSAAFAGEDHRQRRAAQSDQRAFTVRVLGSRTTTTPPWRLGRRAARRRCELGPHRGSAGTVRHRLGLRGRVALRLR